jgi:hypothetical protein
VTVVQVAPSFEDNLEEALERCRLGEPPADVAATCSDHDLLPYLLLAERLRAIAAPVRGAAWFRRSLKRLLARVGRGASGQGGPGGPDNQPRHERSDNGRWTHHA